MPIWKLDYRANERRIYCVACFSRDARNETVRRIRKASAPNPKRWEQVEKVRRLNGLVAAYCRRHDMDFINVFPLMLGPDGLPRPEIFVNDRLRMNEKGYAIWKSIVRPVLVEAFPENQ